MLLATLAGTLLASCANAAVPSDDLRSYLAAIEPLRLGVNALLEDADPIINAYHDHHMTGVQASDAMGRLEATFAAYMVKINALVAPDATLATIQAPYAHTYILEDSYLNALVAAFPDGDFSSLPNTQSQQRAAIIEWRTQLEILAMQVGFRLPADLQQAGRGEIAPAVTGPS